MNQLTHPLHKPEAPWYPGYQSPCNGCGLCCLDRPCPVCQQHDLWRNDKCKALLFRAGRYWCGVVVEPHRFLAITHKQGLRIKDDLKDAIGIKGICDARTAGSSA